MIKLMIVMMLSTGQSGAAIMSNQSFESLEACESAAQNHYHKTYQDFVEVHHQCVHESRVNEFDSYLQALKASY